MVAGEAGGAVLNARYWIEETVLPVFVIWDFSVDPPREAGVFEREEDAQRVKRELRGESSHYWGLP